MSEEERFVLHQPAADFHVHLRDGAMAEMVAPMITDGGVSVALVMPNLTPPVTTVRRAIGYRDFLASVNPQVEYLMTLYLCVEITPAVVYEAAAAGLVGIKSYPKGLTTNSEQGVVDYETFYPVFEAMQECNLVLNLHGESPSSDETTVLNAEARFLPTLESLHRRFPRLRIVLEHCTTSDAVAAVLRCGDTVAATITAHHLFLTIDDWVDNPYSYCKPVAKLPSDRLALIQAATSGNPKFFFGSDSAPHAKSAKKADRVAAGVFTQPYVLSYVAQVFDKVGKLHMLEHFVAEAGRRFYQRPSMESPQHKVILRKSQFVVDALCGQGENAIVPFFANHRLDWAVEWSKT